MAGTVVANYGLGNSPSSLEGMSSYSFDSLPDWRFYEQVETGKQSTSLPQWTAVTNDDDCGMITFYIFYFFELWIRIRFVTSELFL